MMLTFFFVVVGITLEIFTVGIYDILTKKENNIYHQKLDWYEYLSVLFFSKKLSFKFISHKDGKSQKSLEWKQFQKKWNEWVRNGSNNTQECGNK